MKSSTIIRLITFGSWLQLRQSEAYVKDTQLGPLPFPGWPKTDRAHTIAPREEDFQAEVCLNFTGIYIFEKGSRMNTPAMVSYPGRENAWLRCRFSANGSMNLMLSHILQGYYSGKLRLLFLRK